MRHARTLVPLVLAAVAIALVVVATGSGDGKQLRVLAPEARFVSPGSRVHLAGRQIGTVTDAEPTRDGKAVLTLSITDDDVWPLPTGTSATFRWASTIAFTNRRVDLILPRRAAGGTLAENGVIPADDVSPGVEVDEVLATFDGETRQDLRRLIDTTGPAVSRASDNLGRTLEAAPAALGQANALLEDLGGRPERLASLLRQTDRVVHAINASNPGIGQLVSGAATTLEATGARAAEVRSALEQTPRTLDVARRTLHHADASLVAAEDVVRRLDPGVRELRTLAAPLNRTLTTLRRVSPDARATLATLRRATPSLDPLLDKVTTLMPRIKGIGSELDKQGNCLRPYTPEIAGFFSTWAGMTGVTDNKDRFMRAHAVVYPFAAGTQSSGEIKQAFPFLRYGFPRPPGWNSGQPWFIPECKLGTDTIDPFQDPERP